MNVLAIGYEAVLATNWTELVDPPARGNRKPETYEAQLPELWEAKAAGMREELDLAAHAVTRVLGVTGSGQEVFNNEGSPQAGALLLHYLESVAEHTVVLGIGLHRLLKHSLWRARLPSAVSSVGRGFWLSDEFSRWTGHGVGTLGHCILVDPYRLSGAEGAGLSLPRWAVAVGCSKSLVTKLENSTKAQLWLHSADLMALTARSTALAMGMV